MSRAHLKGRLGASLSFFARLALATGASAVLTFATFAILLSLESMQWYCYNA